MIGRGWTSAFRLRAEPRALLAAGQREDRKLAAERGYQGSIHVSGCAKRCARSAPSDLTLIGEDGLYRVGEPLVSRKDFAALIESATDG